MTEEIKNNQPDDDAGVYVISALTKTENPQPFNAPMEKMQLNSRMSYSLPYIVIQDIKDKSDLVDNRLNFY